VLGIGAVAFGCLVLFAGWIIKDDGFLSYVSDPRIQTAGAAIVWFGLASIAKSLKRAKAQAVEARRRVTDFNVRDALPSAGNVQLRLAGGVGTVAVTFALAMLAMGNRPFDGVENDGTIARPPWSHHAPEALFTFDLLVAFGIAWWLAGWIIVWRITAPEDDTGPIGFLFAYLWSCWIFPLIFVAVWKT
jgi:hypothetical protein